MIVYRTASLPGEGVVYRIKVSWLCTEVEICWKVRCVQDGAANIVYTFWLVRGGTPQVIDTAGKSDLFSRKFA